MIIKSIDNLENQSLNCNICIIGGGPAAISIALQLRHLQKKLFVLTGGNWKETEFNRDLNRGIVTPPGSHEPLDDSRRRQFGGGSAAWGGRCVPLDPIDFTERDWVNNTGWPFSYEELLPYYIRAGELSKIGEFKFCLDEDKNFCEIIPGMDSDYLTSKYTERWSPPINFAKEYKTALDDSDNIGVYLDCHAMKICTDSFPEKISHVEAYMHGKKFRIFSDLFVLAAGALENARLLLSSCGINHPQGIGNKFDNVGRYYMVHISGTIVELDIKQIHRVITGYEKDKTDIYFRRRWRLTDDAQKHYQLRNIIFFLNNPNEESENLDPVYSGAIIAKLLSSITRQKSLKEIKNGIIQLKPALRKHTLNLLINGWSRIPDILSKSLKRLSKRRLPSILPSKRCKHWGVYFQSEHTPCRESRVKISNSECDKLGMKRLEVEIKINPEDIESIVKSHNLFISHFLKSGIGSTNYSEKDLREYLDKRLSSFHSGSHHIGTTRMSSSELTGVVDSNSKVFGTDNLFIAGSSVFPTSGHANPTLTIIAQSLRLADYLKKIT